MTDFLDFVLRGFVESVKEIKEKITFWIRFFCLRDYYFWLKQKKEITERQLDLLNTALDSRPFVLKELFTTLPYKTLYRNVSERTGRRDLEKLCEMKLLEIKEGKYTINYNAVA